MNSSINYAYVDEMSIRNMRYNDYMSNTSYYRLATENFDLAIDHLLNNNLGDFDKLKIIDGINTNFDAITWLNKNTSYISVPVILSNLRMMRSVFEKNISLFVEDASIGFFAVKNSTVVNIVYKYGSLLDLLELYNKMTDYSDLKYNLDESYELIKYLMYYALKTRSIKEELTQYLFHPIRIESYVNKFGMDALNQYLE